MDLITRDVVAEFEHVLGVVALLFGTVGVVARFAWKRSVDLRDWRKQVDATLGDHGDRIATLETDPARDRRSARWWQRRRPPG